MWERNVSGNGLMALYVLLELAV